MATFTRFRDRHDAGRVLAARLTSYRGHPGLLVLALPRGGVPVGYEVARALGGELDVFLVRKLGVPGHEELAMGAIASGGVRVLNESVVRALDILPEDIERATRAEAAELERRESAYRGDRPHPRIADRTVILVDDGGGDVRGVPRKGGPDRVRVYARAVPRRRPVVRRLLPDDRRGGARVVGTGARNGWGDGRVRG